MTSSTNQTNTTQSTLQSLLNYFSIIEEVNASPIRGDPITPAVVPYRNSCNHIYSSSVGPVVPFGYPCSFCSARSVFLLSIKDSRYFVSDLVLSRWCNLPLFLYNSYLFDFYKQHARLCTDGWFSVPYTESLPHFHGVTFEDRAANTDGNRIWFPLSDTTNCGDSCWEARELGITNNEAPTSSTNSLAEGYAGNSWSAGCSNCEGMIFMNGPGSYYLLFFLLNMSKVVFANPTRKFALEFVGFKDQIVINMRTVRYLQKVAPQIFSLVAQEALDNNGFIDDEERIEKRWFVRKNRNCDRRTIQMVDEVGGYKCMGMHDMHDWYLQSLAQQWEIHLTGNIGRFFDWMCFGTALDIYGRTRRLRNAFFLPGFNPRVTDSFVISLERRSQNQDIYGDWGSSDEEYLSDEVLNEEDIHILHIRATREATFSNKDEPGTTYVTEWDEVELEITPDSDDELYEQEVAVPYDDEEEEFYESTEDFDEEDEFIASDIENDVIGAFAEQLDDEIAKREEKQEVVTFEVKKSLATALGSLANSGGGLVKNFGNIINWPFRTVAGGFQFVGSALRKESQSQSVRTHKFVDFYQQTWKPVIKDIEESLDAAGDNFNTIDKSFGEISQWTEDITVHIRDCLLEIEVYFNELGEKVHELTNAMEKDTDSAVVLNKQKIERLNDKLNALVDRLAEQQGGSITEADIQLLLDQYPKIVRVQQWIMKLKHEQNAKISELTRRLESLESKSGKNAEIPEWDLDDTQIDIPKRTATLPRFNKEMEGNEQIDVGDARIENVILSADNAVSESMQIGGVTQDRSVNLISQTLSATMIVDQFHWTATLPRAVVFKSLHFPETLFEKNVWLARVYSCFQYFSCESLEIRISSVSVPMHGGTLWAIWDPLSSAHKRGIVDAYSLSSLYRLEISAGGSSVEVLNIPWIAIQNMLSLDGEDTGLFSLGSLHFLVLNSLVYAAGTVAQVNICVESCFKGMKQKVRTVPRPLSRKEMADCPVIGGGIDDAAGMNLSAFTQNESLLYLGTWNGISTSNILNLNVHPCACKISNGSLKMTSLSMISSLFHQWSGAISYRVIIGATQFSKGRLFVINLPGAYILEDLPLEKTLGLPGLTFELSPDTMSFTIDVPFNSVGHYARVSTDGLFDANFHGEALKSRLHFYVSTPLVANTGAAGSVEFAVLVKAGPGFSLGIPRGLTIGSPLLVTSEIMTGINTSQDFIFDNGTNVCRLDQYGVVCKVALRNMQTVRLRVAPYYNTLSMAANAMQWIANCYTRWSGMLQYKFTVKGNLKTQGNHIKIWHLAEGDGNMKEMEMLRDEAGPTGSQPFQVWDLSSTCSYEVCVRYNARYNTLLIPRPQIQLDDQDFKCYYNGRIFLQYHGTEAIEVFISMKSGPGFRLYDRGPLPKAISSGEGGLLIPHLSKFNSVENLSSIHRGENPADPIATEDVEQFPNLTERRTFTEKEIAKGKEPESPTVGQVRKDRNGRKWKFAADGQWRLLRDNRTEDDLLSEGPHFGPKSVRVIRETGGINGFVTRTILGKEQADKFQKLDMEKCVDSINKFSEEDVMGKVSDCLEKMKDIDTAGVNTIALKLGPLIDNLTRMMPEMHKTAENAVEQVSLLTKMGEKLTSFLSNFLEGTIFGHISQLTEHKNFLLALGSTLIVVFAAWKWWSSRSKATVAGSIISLLGIIWAPMIGQNIMAFFSWMKECLHGSLVQAHEWWEKHFGAHKDGGEESVEHPSGVREIGGQETLSSGWSLIEPILMVSMTLTSLCGLGVIPDEKQSKNFMGHFKSFGDKSRCFSNIASAFNMISDLCKKLSTYIVGWIHRMLGHKALKQDTALSLAVNFDLADWMERINIISLEENRFVGIGGGEKVTEIRQLHDKWLLISRELASRPVHASLSALLRDAGKKCVDLMNDAHSNQGVGLSRIDPFHLSIVGAPGVGKSVVASTLLHDMLNEFGYPMSERVFPRNVGDEFWSKYWHQPVVMYDDLGVTTGSTTNTDFSEVLALKTNNALSLNMADLQGKGRQFTSHFILSCTNVVRLDDNTNVRVHDAFYRRRNMFIQAKRDPMIDMDPSDHTKGIIFTVLEANGRGPRQVWDDNFFKRPNGFSIIDWDYARFRPFLLEYTMSYMDNQRVLVSNLREKELRKANPSGRNMSLNPMENIQARLEEMRMARAQEDEEMAQIIGGDVEQAQPIIDLNCRRTFPDLRREMEPIERPTLYQRLGELEVDKPAHAISNYGGYGPFFPAGYADEIEREGVKFSSFEDLVETFNRMGITGKMIEESSWKLWKVSDHNLRHVTESTFHSLITKVCSCNIDTVCSHSIDCNLCVIMNLVDQNGPVLQKLGGRVRWSKKQLGFRFEQLREELSSEPAVWFYGLVAFIKHWMHKKNVCPGYHYQVETQALAGKLPKDIEKLVKNCEAESTFGEVCTHSMINSLAWSCVRCVFPDVIRKFGAVYLRCLDGQIVKLHDFGDEPDFFMAADVDEPGSAEPIANECMNYILSSTRVGTDVNLAGAISESDLVLFRDTLLPMEEMNCDQDLFGEMKEAHDEIKATFGNTKEYVLWNLMIILQKNKFNVEKRLKEEKEIKDRVMISRIQKFKDDQKSWMSECSKPIKVALMAGGFIAGLGGLVLAAAGMYKLSAMFFGDERDPRLNEPGARRNKRGIPIFTSVTEEEIPLGMDEVEIPVDLDEEMPGMESGDQKTQYMRRPGGRKSSRLDRVPKLPRQEGMPQAVKDIAEMKADTMSPVAKITEGTGSIVSNISDWQARCLEVTRVNPTPSVDTERLVFEGEEFRVLLSPDHFLVAPKDVLDGKKTLLMNPLPEYALKLPVLTNHVTVKDNLIEVIDTKVVSPKLVRHCPQNLKAMMARADPQALDIIQNVLWKSCAQMLIVGEGRNFRVQVLRVFGSWVLMPAHFLEVMKPGYLIYLVYWRKVVCFKFEPSNVYLVSKLQDLAMMDCGPRVDPAKNIIDFFYDGRDLSKFNSGPGMLVTTTFAKDANTVIVAPIEKISLVTEMDGTSTVDYDISFGDHSPICAASYECVTGEGTCGSIIVRCDPKTNTRKVLGIHVAGSAKYGTGFCEIVIQEQLHNIIDNANRIPYVIEPTPVEADRLPGYLGVKEMEPTLVRPVTEDLPLVGVLKPEFVPVNMDKSDIEASCLHGLLGPVKTERSILGPYDRRLDRRPDGQKLYGKLDPLIDAVEKYAEPTKPFDARRVVVVEKHLQGVFSIMENSKRRRNILTEEEMINGIPGTDLWQPIKMKTSCGFPYVLERPRHAHGKEWMFEQVGNYESGQPLYVITNNTLRKNIDERENLALKGYRSTTLMVECTKDERRKLEKIYGKVATRSFTCLPVDLNLLFRKYFLDFAVMVMENRARSFCKVGINPDSLEWTQMYNQFKAVSDEGFAGDYAKFDGIGPPEIYDSIVNVINHWYNDGFDNALIRKTLISETYHRLSIVRDGVYQIDQGMPSGFSMTVIFNSITNYYFLAMAWQDLIGQSELMTYKSLRDFDTYTRIATYGDDNVVAVHKDALEFFNLRTVAAWLDLYGIKYTDDQKRPLNESEPFVPIEKMTFLKRGFRNKDKSHFLVSAPLDKISIEERLNWLRKSPDPMEALKQNMDSAFYEAHVHGIDYFEDLKRRVNSALVAQHKDPVYYDFEDQMVRWWQAHGLDDVPEGDLLFGIGQGKLEDGNVALRTRVFAETLEKDNLFMRLRNAINFKVKNLVFSEED